MKRPTFTQALTKTHWKITMLKEVTWPAPLEVKQGTFRTAPEIILEMVMSHAFWRESFERVEAGDTICEVLEASTEKSVFTLTQRDLLLASMKFEGQQITPPAVNRFFIRILRAIHQGADVRETKT